MTTTPTLNAENVLVGHVDETSALLVDDYPYGFRLRTSIRYWIETTKHGDRFVSQTLNPKTDRWNAPKKSTYAPVGAMYTDDKGHVTWTAIQQHSSDEWLAHFTAVVGPHMSAAQRKQLAHVVALKRVFERVTFTVVEGPTTDADRAAQAETEHRISRAVAFETASVAGELAQGIALAREDVA